MDSMTRKARKINFDTTLLRSFVAISEQGGFSEAAQALHLTQSAISHHVRRLEEQLERCLFESQGRRRRLTEEGELFLWYARQILALNDEAFEKLGQRQVMAKDIRLGVSEYFAQDVLPVLLSSARFDRQGIRIRPELGRSTALVRRLDEGKLDMVIAVDVVDWCTASKLDIPVAERSLVWIGTPDLLLDFRHGVSLVAFGPPCILRDLQIKKLKQSQCNCSVVYEARDLGDLLAAVKAGLGVSVLPFTPSRYGLATPPQQLPQLPQLPDVRISVKVRAEAQLAELEWLIQLIRRCWSYPGQVGGNVELQVPLPS